jgi:hypothetical protein
MAAMTRAEPFWSLKCRAVEEKDREELIGSAKKLEKAFWNLVGLMDFGIRFVIRRSEGVLSCNDMQEVSLEKDHRRERQLRDRLLKRF